MRNLEILNDHSTIMMNLKACEQNPSLKHSMLRYATQQRHTAGCLYNVHFLPQQRSLASATCQANPVWERSFRLQSEPLRAWRYGLKKSLLLHHCSACKKDAIADVENATFQLYVSGCPKPSTCEPLWFRPRVAAWSDACEVVDPTDDVGMA